MPTLKLQNDCLNKSEKREFQQNCIIFKCIAGRMFLTDSAEVSGLQ
jgi:hypothetical protein